MYSEEQESIVNSQWSRVNRQWSRVIRQWSRVGCQGSIGSGQGPVVKGQLFATPNSGACLRQPARVSVIREDVKRVDVSTFQRSNVPTHFHNSHHERLRTTKDENASGVERIASGATDSPIRPFADSLIFAAERTLLLNGQHRAPPLVNALQRPEETTHRLGNDFHRERFPKGYRSPVDQE